MRNDIHEPCDDTISRKMRDNFGEEETLILEKRANNNTVDLADEWLDDRTDDVF